MMHSMNIRRSVFVSIALAAVFGAFTLTIAPLQAADKAGSVAAVYRAKETAEFKKLAKETIEALAAGKTTEMVAKLTDLETIWDEKEKSLKPKNEVTWTTIDKTLDKAISALRSSKVNLKKGKTALEDLLKMLDQATKS